MRGSERPLTTDEQKDLLSRFSVPDWFAGFKHDEGLHLVTLGTMPGGVVNTAFFSNGLKVTNTTTPVHTFVGTIDRQIVVSDGATYIETHGYGNAGDGWFGGFRDAVNQLYGPAIFLDLDSSAAYYAFWLYGGC